jgi:hypothetical protein
MITTVRSAKAAATERGFHVLAFNGGGRRYLVTNFRGGRCFQGNRSEFIAWAEQFMTYPLRSAHQ